MSFYEKPMYCSFCTRSTLLKIVVSLIGIMAGNASHSAGEVSSLVVQERAATPFEYEVDGVSYLWGMGNNQILTGLTVDGRAYDFGLAVDRVLIRRDDIEGVSTGEPCGVFVESIGVADGSRTQAADYPGDPGGSGNCDLEAMLGSRVINRGAVDLFSNTFPDAKNIERLDYLFDYGVSAPFDPAALDSVGHPVSEKSGNNPVQIAAITSLDDLGEPATYGPLVKIVEVGCSDPVICYGDTDLSHAYSMLQNDLNAPQSFPVETERSFETVSMALVSLQVLGLAPGQRYFGVSLFADDVDAALHDLTDPSTFPDNTSDDYIVVGDDADIHGGLSGFFVADDLNNVSGAVFIDANGNGVPDAGEAGVGAIELQLYTDENGNGLLDEPEDNPFGEPLNSNMSGEILLPGLPPGSYLLVLDETDPDLPPGLVLGEGVNPRPVTIAGTDADPAYFAFTNPADDGPLDDAATLAVDDVFSIEQGANATNLDVLANDNDGAGAGLTLVSVSQSPNSSISVDTEQNQVIYQPDVTFYGTDSFSYVMEDTDGTQQTGNVTVRVRLTLETGVDGIGIGHLSMYGLLMLALVFVSRRIRFIMASPVNGQAEYMK
ncbi:MAG: Ig-like domain-containing protein [Granulosicoccus sp.]